jgi:hypothetical protein
MTTEFTRCKCRTSRLGPFTRPTLPIGRLLTDAGDRLERNRSDLAWQTKIAKQMNWHGKVVILYAPCGGDGLIYVYSRVPAMSTSCSAKVPSGPGGKNGLMAESLGRYFVIVPPQGSTLGAVYAYSTQ